MIQNVGTQFTQWDTGRIVSISDSAATHVHFANQGDSKAVIVEIEGGTAKVPDYLFHTGKSVFAYAVLDGITLETKSFAVRKRERPENYVYEDDQRNYIYVLITNAEKAVKDAGAAATAANNAAANASEATTRATTATGNANAAANNAITAADSANKAAAKAAHTAKSLMVVGQAKGSPISLDDVIDQYFVGFRIFGKTTQNGTPTPEAPVELVSIGDGGSITVNVTGENETQSMTISTPNGLPGIPVTSGGNYTDANGQQWVCDEIDFARGVYVQRVCVYTVDGTVDAIEVTVLGANVRWIHLLEHIGQEYKFGNTNGFFSHGSYLHSYSDDSVHSYVYGRYIYAFMPTELVGTTAESIRSYEMAQYEAGAPLIMVYPLATPIETPLSAEELAAYAALHTYRGHTTVSNDAGAWMGIDYVMDAKKYIDSVIAQTIHEATVE